MFLENNELASLDPDQISSQLAKKVQKLYDELNISEAELMEFLQNSDNFTSDEWESLQKAQKKLQESVDSTVPVRQNPNETKKKYNQNSQVQLGWLHIR